MNATEFEEVALALVAHSYSPLVIAPRCEPRPDGRKVTEGKAPGVRVGGEWRLAHDWQKWCYQQVSEHMVRAWGRMLGPAEDAGIGVACGQGLICIDIDQEFLLDPVLAILPSSPVQKKGRKGVSLFYRGDTEKIRSRNYRTKERVGLLDLLAEGKQTVLPPSVHPDTNEPYFWWTDATLCDTPLSDLPELPDDIADQLAEVLKPFGYDLERDRAEMSVALDVEERAADVGQFYRKLNEDALANLHAWVPELGFARYRARGAKYEAVAPWRLSGTGRPFEKRGYKLSVSPMGIQDFGTGEKFTALNLVMKALEIPESALDTAVEWLGERLGYDFSEAELVNGPKTLERIRARDAAAWEAERPFEAQSIAPTTARQHEKFRVTMFDDIDDSEKKEWVVEGFIAAGEFTYAVGKPGASKSVIFTDAACHVGAGMEWHGRPVKKGLVVYLAAERSKVTRRRMMAFRKHHQVSGVPVAIIEGKADLTNGVADAVALAERIVELGETHGLPPVWIIVDTLSRTFGGADQNKSQDMGKFVRAVDTIIEKTGAHVTVIHHTPWEQERAKGAIDLDGAVDASFLVRSNNGRCTLRCDGGNDQEEGLIAAYTMKSVVVGTDENGKVTDAPVVIRDEAATDSEDGDIRLRSKKPVLAVRLFEIAIREKGERNPTDGRTAVHKSNLKEIIHREQRRGSNATDASRESMVRRIIGDIRAKFADEIGEYLYPKAANDNIKDQRTGTA